MVDVRATSHLGRPVALSPATAIDTPTGTGVARPPSPAVPHAAPAWFWPAIIALVLVHAIASWHLRLPAILTGGDDAVYIQLAREVQQFSYRDQFLIGAPGHVKFPPGYPAFLAAISAVAGESLDAFLFGGIAATVCGLLLLADAARRRLSPAAGLLIITATFMNPRLIQYSGMVMSEALFFLCVAAAVWALSHDELTRRNILLAGAAAIAAALTRSAGITIVIAVVITLLLARHYRRAIIVAAAAVVINGAWFVWTTRAPEQIAGSQGENYVSDTFALPNTASPSLARNIALRVFFNSRRYATRTVPSLLPFPHVPGTLVDNVFFVGCLGVLLAVGTWRLLRSWTVVPVVVMSYVSLLLAWPWVVIRFMSPMTPFIVVLMIAGAFVLVSRVRTRWRLLIPASVAVTIALTAAGSLKAAVVSMSACDRGEPIDSSECVRPEERDFLQLAQWVADSVDQRAVFLVAKEGTFGYLTGRKTMPLLTAIRADSSEIFRLLRDLDVTHVALTTHPHAATRLADLLLPSCHSLALEKELSPTLLVLRVGAEQTPDGNVPSSCDALARYRELMVEREARG